MITSKLKKHKEKAQPTEDIRQFRWRKDQQKKRICKNNKMSLRNDKGELRMKIKNRRPLVI